MLRRRSLLALLLAAASRPADAASNGLLEPRLFIAKGGPSKPRVALTFDACGGEVDLRILSTLIDNRVHATIFVTRKWLRSNSFATGVLQANSDLFQLENHGAEHVPAVLGTEKVDGITPAGTLEGVTAEVDGGARAIIAAGSPQPRWYRGATALYSPAALQTIRGMGFAIGGYSLNGDHGASDSTADAAKQVGSAKDGDVILSHINQPRRPAGEGVVQGVLALKAKGITFVRLDQVEVIGGAGDL